MTRRFLVVEVVDTEHDLSSLIDTMINASLRGRAILSTGGYTLNVRMLRGHLAKEVGTIKDTDTDIYVTEGRS